MYDILLLNQIAELECLIAKDQMFVDTLPYILMTALIIVIISISYMMFIKWRTEEVYCEDSYFVAKIAAVSGLTILFIVGSIYLAIYVNLPLEIDQLERLKELAGM